MKFVLAMLFPMAMTGTTVSATVDCGSGPIGGIGVGSASCTAPGASFTTSASAGAFGIEVAVGGGNPPPFFVTASATSDSDLLVEVTGSTGTALFVPCFFGAGDSELAPAVVTVSGAINGSTVVSSSKDLPQINTCGGPGFTPPGVAPPNVSFTFGQPFTIDLSLSGQGQAEIPGALADGQLSVNGYEVLDAASLNPISGAIITVTTLPEPNTGLLMMLALGVTIVMACLRASCRFRS
jgi:hypothetical protein